MDTEPEGELIAFRKKFPAPPPPPKATPRAVAPPVPMRVIDAEVIRRMMFGIYVSGIWFRPPINDNIG